MNEELILPSESYVEAREAYDYCAPKIALALSRTRLCPDWQENFTGIFSRKAPRGGINLRYLEKLCQTVFTHLSKNFQSSDWSIQDSENVRAVVEALVSWKMASQGGRSQAAVARVRDSWNSDVLQRLSLAFGDRSIAGFVGPGIGLPTASVFLRFLWPSDYGVLDRMAATKTQASGATSFATRADDGYIFHSAPNTQKYHSEYVPFLRAQANQLNDEGITFFDVDANGQDIRSQFRACDIEMAFYHLRP